MLAGVVAAPVVWLTFARILMPRPEPGRRLRRSRRPASAGRTAAGVTPRPRGGAGMTRGAAARVVPRDGHDLRGRRDRGTARRRDRARRALAAARREIAVCEARALALRPRQRPLAAEPARAAHGWRSAPRLIEALAAALRARAETDGRFDPTILPALAAAGYDRSFELLDERAPTALDGWRPARGSTSTRAAGRARIEPGAAVDLGGIGKGFAATRALHAMRAAWPEHAGSSRRSRRRHRRLGRSSRRRALAHRHRRPARARARARNARADGVAASRPPDATRGGSGPVARLHHLIDPSTGRPGERRPARRHGRRSERRGGRGPCDRARGHGERRGIRTPRVATRPRQLCSYPISATRSRSAALPLAREPRRVRFTVNA